MKEKINKSNGLMAFASRLKKLRLSLKLNQTLMAQTLGYTNSFLSELENGKGKPSYEFLLKLECLHKVNLGWLMQGNGSMFLNNTESNQKNSTNSHNNFDSNLKTFHWYFEHSPVFKHNVLGFALKFLREYQDIIERDVEIYMTEIQEVNQNE